MFPKRRVKFTISIHSTARVETVWYGMEWMQYQISIHSTARVETTLGATVLWKVMYFNPLHREGGDSLFANPVQEKADFNPLHREGGDRGQGTVDVIVVDFNPLHREGGDR